MDMVDLDLRPLTITFRLKKQPLHREPASLPANAWGCLHRKKGSNADLHWLLGGGRIVEVYKGMPIDFSVEDWEVPPQCLAQLSARCGSESRPFQSLQDSMA